jgi:cytochrome P450
MYPDPDTFKPERFINADGTLHDDPALTSAFRFGKQVCPGRHFVDASFFIIVASLLSVFNIEKGKDKDSQGLDAYPFIGNDIMYSHHTSLMAWIFECSCVTLQPSCLLSLLYRPKR